MDKISKRNEKVAFFGMDSRDSSFARMRGFTEFSINKNPIEYSRKYIDEQTERSDVVAYAPSISYSFDKFSDDFVHKELINISDNEMVGNDATRDILIVDFSTDEDVKDAICRNWTIIPDGEGKDPNAYTYSGTLKANGDIIFGTVVSTDGWQTCSFLADNG